MDGLFSQREDVLKTPRKSARGQGPHLERLSEHLKLLQKDLLSDKVARESASKDALGEGTPRSRGKTPRHLTPRAPNITPRNMSNQGLQPEINRLRRELAEETEARQAAAGRALISADEAAAAAQWAEAVTHENEKLHQLIDMQRSIISDLQGGNPVVSPSVSQAQSLSKMALAAKGMSQEACELRDSLLSRTGHAKALEQKLAEFKEQNSNLRKCMAAKEAELAVVRAELEALRRMQAQPALTAASGRTDSHFERPQNLPHDEVHKKRLREMQQRLLNRTIAIEEVWAEVKLGEERERILSAIAQASETHVKILQEELCKAHAETAAVKDDLSERQRTINQHTEAVAASAGNVAKIRALETSAKEDMHLVAELRKRLQEAEVHVPPKRASHQQQKEEAQGAAAVASRDQEAAVQTQTPVFMPSCSPPLVVQAQHSRSPVPRIWQSAQTDLPEANLRRSSFFPADPKQASLTSPHEAALSLHRGSAERSGSLRSNAVVTTTFIVPSSGAQPASSASDAKCGSMDTRAADAEVSPGGSERAVQDGGNQPAETCNSRKSTDSTNSRGEKRDVRGVSRVEKPASDTASKRVPLRRSVYTPVKLQDMTQLGPAQQARCTPGSSSARGQQAAEEDRWTPLSERRSCSSPSPPLDVSQSPWPALTFSPAPLHVEHGLQAPLPARSPLSEMQLPPVGSHSKHAPEHLEKGSPVSGCVLSPGQAPTPETCMSPLLRFTATPGSKGEQLKGGSKQAGRGMARKAPTPKATTGKHAAGFRDAHATPDARKHALPELEASLCNLHGSPLSPPDIAAAEKACRAPAISSLERPSALSRDPHGAAATDALVSTAASPFQAAASAPPFGCGLSIEQQPGSDGVHRARTVLTVQGLDPLPGSGSPLDSPALLQGASTPIARGVRPRVPSLNLSGSLRISMEAITPPCSFPLRGHAAEAAVTDRHLSTSSARSLSSDEDGGGFHPQSNQEQNARLNGAIKGTCTLAQPAKQDRGAYGGWGPLRDGRRGEEADSDGGCLEDCMPTGRSMQEAVYELGIQDDSKGSRILGETSTFLVASAETTEPPKAASGQDFHKDQGSGQQEVAVPVSAPSKAEAGERLEPTPCIAAKRGPSVFQRLSPLLKKKGPPGEANQEVTPRERVPPSGETTPVKGLAKLSPARWKWGCKSGKAAAAETCSPLRDGAAAAHFPAPGQNGGAGSSPQKGGRRRLSSAKLAPWLGR